MQPTWMDNTERGSAHARSEPVPIQRPRSFPAAAAAQLSRDSLFKSLLFAPGSRDSRVSPKENEFVGFAATAGAYPGVRPVSSSSLTRANESFGTMPFVGGEEEAHDHWHDRWSDMRRTSMEEQRRERDAMAIVFGQAQISKHALTAARGVYPAPKTTQIVADRRGKAQPRRSTREDIYGGNFWG
jgi:hypothetical protein|mmetsp:Transcript_8748/g.32759  ORF Transcript_8748/g.32759 Transcript_8748/m.32759 type:complete len:185 (-) Transcript_8748:1755-2309(-)